MKYCIVKGPQEDIHYPPGHMEREEYFGAFKTRENLTVHETGKDVEKLLRVAKSRATANPDETLYIIDEKNVIQRLIFDVPPPPPREKHQDMITRVVCNVVLLGTLALFLGAASHSKSQPFLSGMNLAIAGGLTGVWWGMVLSKFLNEVEGTVLGIVLAGLAWVVLDLL